LKDEFNQSLQNKIEFDHHKRMEWYAEKEREAAELAI
jgi:hypothetical protein